MCDDTNTMTAPNPHTIPDSEHMIDSGTDEFVTGVARCITGLGPHFPENVSLILNAAKELLHADSAAYRRFIDDELADHPCFNCPKSGTGEIAGEESTVCGKTVSLSQGECFTAGDLRQSPFAHHDPCIVERNINCFVGHVVALNDEHVGVLCLACSKDRSFSPPELQIVASLAALLTREEERLASERKLRLSEQRFRNIVENIHDVYYEAALDGTILDISPSIQRFSGYQREEMIGLPCTEYLADPSDRDRLLSLVLENGAVPEYETLLKDKDGTAKPFSVSLRLACDERGAPSRVVGTLRNISDRVTTLEALRESETKYQDLVDSLPEVIFETDREGFITLINRHALTIFGYHEDDYRSGALRALDCLDEQDRTRAAENIALIMSGEIEERVAFNEYTGLRKDGTTFPVLIGSRPIIRYGRITGLRGIIIDITDRKLALEALEREESRLAALLKLSQMTDATEQEICEFVLEKAVELTGSEFGHLAFTSEDETTLIMHAWSSATLENCRIPDPPRIYPTNRNDIWSAVVRGRKPIIINDCQSPHPYTREEPFPRSHVPLKRLVILPVLDGRKVVAVAGIANKKSDYNDSDLSQLTLLMDGMWKHIRRRRADEALKMSEELFSRVFYTSPVGTVLSSLDSGHIIRANEAFARLVGYETDELIGRSAVDLGVYADLSERSEIVRLLKTKGSVIGSEIRIKTKSGDIHTCLGSADLIEIGGKQLMLGQVVDITDRRAVENELRLKNEELRDALAVKGEFLSMVSHELRTPLVPILGYSEMILSNTFGEVPEALRKPIQILHDRAESLRVLIEDLLQLSRLERRNISIVLEPLSVSNFLPDIISPYQDMDFGKPVNIRLEGPDFTVRADPSRLRQVIQNLLGNAVKYSGDSVEIVVHTEVRNGMGLISVGDNGVGISEEKLPRIFDRFYQAEPVDTRSHDGTGLGLAICKELVELMGGSISVRSKLAVGSVFTVALPVLRKHAALDHPGIRNVSQLRRAIGREPAPPPAEPTRKPCIVVIDDDEFTLRLVEFILGKKHRVLLASNGTDGLEIIRSSKVDLVLLDWMMPGVDGLSCMISLKSDKNTRDIPIVFISGKAEQEAIDQALSAGAADFITKPFRKDELARKVEEVLSTAKPAIG